MNIIALFQLAIFAGYLIIVGKVRPSISETYYYLQSKNKSHYFYWFTGALGLSMILQNANPWYGGTQMIFGAAGVLLPAISFAANYKDQKVGRLHLGITYATIISIFYALGLHDWPSWSAFLPALAFAGITILIRKIPNRTYWIEVAAFVCIFARLIFKP